VAQQEAERAKYEVDQAKEAKKSTIIKAEASAKSIELVGQASKNNPCIIGLMQLIWT
jgi:prohibitin 2